MSFFFFKQKTAYERRISDWSSDVCSSDLRVIKLPADLDELPRSVLPGIKRFLQWAKRQGGDQSYTAQHRRAWWAVGLKAPAPIICTYMARRAPAFVSNLCDARHIHIAPGLYHRQPLDTYKLYPPPRWCVNNGGAEKG